MDASESGYFARDRNFLDSKAFFFPQYVRVAGESPMNSARRRHAYRTGPRAHRLDPRQESRLSLALILLMGFATLSVMATTQVQSAWSTSPVPTYSQR